MLDKKDIPNLILTVTFVATFIGLFFFTYAAKVEKEIVVQQVKYITNDFTSLLRSNLDPSYKMVLKSALSNITPPDMSEQDNLVSVSNAKLLKKAMMVLGSVLAVGVFGAYYLAKKFNVDFKDVVVRNLIMLVFIGVVEFSIATFVAKNFISADPNYVKRLILDTVQESFSNTSH